MGRKPTAEPYTDGIEALRATLKSQYQGALTMLRGAIEQCPDDLWAAEDHDCPYWQIAYHTLFYAHLYIQPTEHDFEAWEHHQTDIQYLDRLPAPAEIENLIEPPDRKAQTGKPYTKAQLLEYWTFCDSIVDPTVDKLDLLDADSGFSWKKMSRAEHQIASIRHIQHHTAQLSARLRDAGGEGVGWISVVWN